MTATLTAPTREALAALVTEAAKHRETQLAPCCWLGEPCHAHEPAAAMTRALQIVQLAVERADTGAEALEDIRSLRPHVIAEITGATTDEWMKAAIGGGTDGGTE